MDCLWNLVLTSNRAHCAFVMSERGWLCGASEYLLLASINTGSTTVIRGMREFFSRLMR